MQRLESAAAEWIQKLYGTYYDRLCTLARAKLTGVGLADMADDVVQETMKQVFEKKEELMQHPKIGGWLYKNVHFRCNNLIRSGAKQIKRTGFSIDAPDAPEIADRRAGEALEECLATKRSYKEAVDYLKENASESDYRLFEQVYQEGKQIGDLSKQYGISASAMSMRVSRMRRRMIDMLTAFLRLLSL